MASQTVVEALDYYWNPFVEQDEFTTITERLSDWRNDEVTNEVSRVNDKSADTFWRGTTDIRTWKSETKRSDVITTPAGHKLYPSFDRFGNRLIRWFIDDESNYTFRISLHRVDRGEFIQVTMFRNVKTATGYWRGTELSHINLTNPYSDLTEQRAMFWILGKLNLSLN